MRRRVREGVALAFQDNESTDAAMILVHGWGCDHTTLERQETFFNPSHRLVNVDLRGHGESDSPDTVYSVELFADDLAWLCRELSIDRAIIIGHSMGGSVAVETAHRHPNLVRAVGLIDTVFQAPTEVLERLAPLLARLQGADFEESYRNIMFALSLPSDLTEVGPVIRSMPRAPQHVLLSALQQHLERHNFERAAAACSMPVAYIRGAHPLADLGRLKQLVPHISIGQTLGSGHFAPWLVPDQVNAMLCRFLELIKD